MIIIVWILMILLMGWGEQSWAVKSPITQKPYMAQQKNQCTIAMRHFSHEEQKLVSPCDEEKPINLVPEKSSLQRFLDIFNLLYIFGGHGLFFNG